jgi:hypothetical protein
LLVSANVPISLILVKLMMEAIRCSGKSVLTTDILTKEAILSSETSVLTRTTLRYIPDDGILHSHRRKTLTSYIELTGWVL